MYRIVPDTAVSEQVAALPAEALAPLLAPKYLAELETQVVIDRVEDDPQIVHPDVSVTSPDVSAGAPSAPVAA